MNQGINQKVGNWATNWWFDFVDANQNMIRAEGFVRNTPNGLQTFLNLIVFGLLTIVWAALAWKFDFSSTYYAFDDLTKSILDSILPVFAESAAPRTVAFIVAALTALITVTPTLVQIFTSNLAKQNVLAVKMAVLGTSIFDVVTDIPVTKAWIDSHQATFDAIPLGGLWYWFIFFFWLLFATVGFQLLAVIFGFATIGFIGRLSGKTWMQPSTVSHIPSPFKNMPQPSKVQHNQPAKVGNEVSKVTVVTDKE